MITESAHLPAALACGDIEVAALVDPVLDRVSGLARRNGIAPLLARDVAEVIGQIDAAVIATPNDTHAAIATKCIGAGIPVLIEKPLASNASEGRAIIELATARGVLVAAGYVTRFRPNLRLLKSLLDRRYFGRVRRFVHQFGTPGGWAPLSGYNLKRASAGGGVLMVTGTHFLDRMLWFWGMPSEVSYFDDSRGGRRRTVLLASDLLPSPALRAR
jgi:predicted dehydrogenase